jgi:chromate transporter
MIPLMMAECVDERQWISEQEFTEALGMCNMLPGPISAKMSLWVGFRVAGPLGAAVAVATVMGPALVLMSLLMAVYLRTRDSPVTQGAMAAIKPAVVGLLVWVVLKLGVDSIGSIGSIALGVAALGALLLRVHPALVMSGALLIGALLMRPPPS